MDHLKILVLDDEKGYRDGLEELLQLHGHDVVTAELPSQAFPMLENEHIDILLLDLQMPEMSGLEVLRRMKKKDIDTEVIIISGHGEMQSSIEAMRYGAIDFITKPFHGMEIENAIERTRKFKELNRKFAEVEKNYSLVSAELQKKIGARMIGKSAAIRKIVSLMTKVAAADDTTVLITGESGTGKELVARGIHGLSARKSKYFHSVNCTAVPETLFESEFFGHHKGAFTGASETLPGWFEISNEGTLFLDEISGLPLNLQSKFLRVLDQKTISKLGSKKEIMLNIRVITASNQDILAMVKDKTFREDLYHRLNGFSIKIPPLRERREDIPLLLDYFLGEFALKCGKVIHNLDDSIYSDLEDYHFPGNVRELKNMVERAVILCEGNTLRRRDFLVPDSDVAVDGKAHNGFGTLNLDSIEQSVIRQAMVKTRGNKTRASALLGISRQALDRKLK